MFFVRRTLLLFSFAATIATFLPSKSTPNFQPRRYYNQSVTGASKNAKLVSQRCACPPFSSAPTGPAYTAVITDPRASASLVIAIRHMSCSLPQGWVLMLVMAHSMRDFVFAELADLLRIGKLRVLELSNSTRALHRVCPNFNTREWCIESTVSALEATPWPTTWELSNEILLYEPLFLATPTSHFVVFQMDGRLCRPLASTNIFNLSPMTT